MEIYLLIGAATAILTAVIADAKGRNFFPWLGLGAVFGIFALAYVAFAPAQERRVKSSFYAGRGDPFA